MHTVLLITHILHRIFGTTKIGGNKMVVDILVEPDSQGKTPLALVRGSQTF